MNQNLKIILICLGFSILSNGLMIFLDFFVLSNLGDWTMQTSGKFLALQLMPIDRNLVRLFPLIIGIIMIVKKPNEIRLLLKTIFQSFLSTVFMIFMGIILALLIWSNETAKSPLLPQYIKYQPIQNYWTLFIIIGIVIPIMFYLLKQTDKPKN